MSFVTRLLAGSEPEEPEIELSESDLRPQPLTGASIERVAERTRSLLETLTGRREQIVAEIDRLTGELDQTDTVIRAQDAALAVLDGRDATVKAKAAGEIGNG